MLCDLLLCFVSYTGPSPIANYLTMQLTAPLDMFRTSSPIHTLHIKSNKSRLNVRTQLANTIATTNHSPVLVAAAGRSELLHPDKPSSFDPLRPFEQYIRSQFAALETPSAAEQLRKDVPSLSTNFSNLALHSPAIVAAAAALTKSASTSVAPPSDSLAENQVIMRPKHHQYLRSQPPQQAATAASSVQQPPPPPLETHFDRTSNNQSSGNNSRNNRRIGRHESRYTSGNEEHSYF